MKTDHAYRMNLDAINRLPAPADMSPRRYLDEMLLGLDQREIERAIKAIEPIYHGARARRPQ